MGRIRAVLLDIDGTLIDSNDAHATAWVEVANEFGFAVPFERIRPLIGMGGDHIVEQVFGLSETDPRGERLRERRKEIFLRSHLPHLEPFPRVRELLEAFGERGLRRIIATSAGAEEVTPLLERAGVADLVDGATSSDDAEASKPAPDIVEAALERARCASDEVLMVGDTPYDVEAASRAGVGCVAFRSGGHFTDEDFVHAVAVYDGPADLLTKLEASPFAR